MKSYLYILLGILLAASCIEDKGNYDYIELKEVAVDNLPDEIKPVLLEPFTLTAVVVTDIDTNNLEYLWFVNKDTLSHGKSMTFVFKDQAHTGQILHFEVRDKTTDVRYDYRMKVIITTNFRTGWMVLSEVDGLGYFSFKSHEGEKNIYLDIFKEMTGESLGSKPRRLSYLNNHLAIACEGGNSAELSGEDFSLIKYYADEFRGADFAPEYIDIRSMAWWMSGAASYCYSGKNIYSKPCSYGVFDQGGWFEYPLETEDNLGYETSSNVVETGNFFMMHDDLNGRYMTYRNNNNPHSTLLPLPKMVNENPAFNPADAKGECVWMSDVNRYPDPLTLCSILKQPDNSYVLHMIQVKYDYDPETGAFLVTWHAVGAYVFDAGVVDDNSRFAVNPNISYLYVATGKKLGVVNLKAVISGEHAKAFNWLKDYGWEITAMKIVEGNASVMLGVMEEQPTAELPGKLLRIKANPTDKGMPIDTVHNVGGKIVDVFYKAN